MIELERYQKNPILSPTKNWWESLAVLNCGATLFKNKIILLYRARGGDFVSRFGLAESCDGKKIDERLKNPVYEPDINDPYTRLGVEDPRITKIGKIFYITYVAASLYEAGHKKPAGMPDVPYRARVGLLTTRDFKKFKNYGIILPQLDDKDAGLFPEKFGANFVLLHRLYPHIWISYSKDLKHWEKGQVLAKTRKKSWDCQRIGAGSPPIKTEKGWLLFYHGQDSKKVYRLGIILLDSKNPKKILYRSEKPILEPEMSYEKKGQIPNVVFTCGAVEKDDFYYLYYGAADKVICLAIIKKSKLLGAI